MKCRSFKFFFKFSEEFIRKAKSTLYVDFKNYKQKFTSLNLHCVVHYLCIFDYVLPGMFADDHRDD